MADAKYVVGDHRNGDAKIELDANKKQFTGLTKEELMKYAEDPFWVGLRWAMFVLFWVLWLAMLAAAIAIIVQAPKCALPAPKTWYEKGPHVDMSSAESYSEIEAKLPEMKEANIAGIFTYVCKDAYEVLEEKPGCIAQFKEFLVKAQSHGIKVIVDLVANYVPKTHKWFELSENRSAEYDTFTWAKGKDYESDSTKQKPPNEWVSTMNEPAWTWSESRREYYLHQFADSQPDLNFHNAKVVEKFDAVIKAWMDAGADGIRLRNARSLLVDASLAEEVRDSGASGADHTQYQYWQHRRTADRPELDALLAHWAHRAQAGEKVFTILEDETRTELYLLDRNTSYLRPPSARPVSVAAPTAASDISARVKRWPLIQLVDGADSEDDSELAVFAMVLPAAPVLAPRQLPVRDNTTDASTSFDHASLLRADNVIAHGRSEVAAVSATTPDAPQLLACARWMENHLSYLGVYNPGPAAARANLTVLNMLPPALNVHYMSAAVKQNTNYTSTTTVPIDDVLVPSKSSVVFSYKYKSAVET
ncbi:maltase A2 isoform X2 [Aricia agestis]|nr:maltase A2 isoform X2 [Aricia agestis]